MSDWNEVAHDLLDKVDNEPIKANPTNLAAFGAPAVAIVTALLAGILGTAWSLDPKKPAVVIAAAIIIAAVVLGVYFAFATDIRARGAVTRARYEAISALAAEATASDAADAKKSAETAITAQKNAEAAQKAAENAQKAAEAGLADAIHRRDLAEMEIRTLKDLASIGTVATR